MDRIITDRPARRGRSLLVVIGLLSAAGYLYVSLAMPTSNRPAHVALFLGVFLMLFSLYFGGIVVARSASGGQRLMGVILLFAVVFRLIMVAAGLPKEDTAAALAADLRGERVAFEPFLLYDNDIWRYLWGGHVLAEGQNPYLMSPDQVLTDPDLEERLIPSEPWRDVHDYVSFQSYRTVYPPAMHYFFAALARIAPASAGAAKLALVIVDLLLCLLLWHVLASCGLRGELTILYAWNPAVIKEIAGSGHPDVLMMLPLLAVPLLLWRGLRAGGGIVLGLSVLAKVSSAIALPLVALWSWRLSPERRYRATLAVGVPVAFGLTVAAGFWPLLAGAGAWLEALSVFADRWTFNSGPWQVVRWLADATGAERPERVAHGVCRTLIVLLTLAIAWFHSRRRPGGNWRNALVRFYRALFWTLAVLILFSPAVMPWYVLWALPMAVVAGNRAWPVFTGLALLSYLNYADGAGLLWWKWLEYGLFGMALVWDAGRRDEAVDLRLRL